jgi:DNA-binding MarR family transcriptional regulator
MGIYDCINYMLTVAQHEVFLQFSDALSQYGITPGQYGVLSCLWENGAATPKELARYLSLENSSISGLLDRLQKQGLIDRLLDPNDRRSIRVVTTQQGTALKEAVLLTVERLNDSILGDLTPDEKVQLAGMLQHIATLRWSRMQQQA